MITKRNVVSLIEEIYDPLGFLSPIIVQFKRFMRELCKVKLGWDYGLSGTSSSQGRQSTTHMNEELLQQGVVYCIYTHMYTCDA